MTTTPDQFGDNDESMDRLRPLIDHTLLTPEATPQQVETHIREAVELGLTAVCLRPNMIPVDYRGGLRIVTVCGFPSGAHDTEVKALEAERALARGADDIDMVIGLGAVKAHDWETVRDDIRIVRAVVPTNNVLKVIIEAAVLTDDEIVRCCQIGQELGVDYIKTSTGYHPAGGASLAHVTLMSSVLDGDVRIKASGGIRTFAEATAFVDAGAARLGISNTRALLAGAASDASSY